MKTFSDSIRRKVPEFRRTVTRENVQWILRNPVGLTPLERKELIALIKTLT